MGITERLVKTVFFILSVLIFLTACEKKDIKTTKEAKKLSVITSLFPVYDFAKEIAKDKASVTLLLPPGIEPHSFEPKPADMVSLSNADIFIYTNKYMEPWTDDILKGISNQNLIVVDTSKGIKLAKQKNGHSHHGKKNKHEHLDPHIWLDFSNAIVMIDNITEGLIKKDPSNSGFYKQNAEVYKKRIIELDEKFKKSLDTCEKKIFISGGHFSFGYLADRYGLKYISAFEGFSPDAEPSARQISKIIKTMKEHGLKHIFYEELITPRIAETVQRETGASLLLLHAAHNISKNELAKGETFMSLMEKNLQNLITGLQCQQK